MHKLKILSGLHKDSVIPLKHGTVTLGSSYDCDIILSDKDIAGKHLEIEVKKEVVFINLLGNPVTLDGKKPEISKGKLSFNYYQQINVGNSSFSISDHTGEWLTKTYDDNPVDLLDIQEFTPHPKKEKTSFISKKVAFFAVISGLLLTFFIPLIYKSTIDARLSNESTLGKASLPSHDNDSILLVKNDDGNQNKKINIDTKKALESDAQNKVFLILQSFGMTDINMDLNDNGLLKVFGSVKDSSTWELAKAAILQDISFVKEINDNELITSGTVRIKIEKLLEVYGLNEKLIIDSNNTLCTITGELQSSEYIKWEELKKRHLESKEISSKFIDEVVDITKALNLSIQSVSIGKTSYFVSTSGVKYMAGSDLENGYTVSRIEPNKVVLTYKNKEVSVHYAEPEELIESIEDDFVSKILSN